MEKRRKKRVKREREGKRAGDKSEKEVGPRGETEVERERGKMCKWRKGGKKE